MTDFQFTNGGGVNVTLRTDFIGDATQGGNLTVCDIVGVSGGTEEALFANIQRNKTTIAELKAFATANSLTLNSTLIGKSAAPVTLVA